MKRSLILIFIGLSFTGCSILKPAIQNPSVVITDQYYQQLIHESVSEILAAGWLSDFLTSTNERPILMVSKISNDAKVSASNHLATGWFEKELIESGQVRVVKTTESQREQLPLNLVKGESVDFVISANFEKQVDTSPAIIIFVVSLWSDTNNLPIIEVKKEIVAKLSEQ